MRWATGLVVVGLGCAVASALALMGGCNIVGAAGVLISGPPKVPAVTELDDERTTVLLVDDLNTRLPRASLRDRIGRAAEEDMLRQGVVDRGRLIASSSVRRVVAADTNEARTSIVDAGRAVGAEVVVHVSVEGWTLESTPGEISPASVVTVRIVDTLANERLWPPGEAPFVLSVELPLRADRAISSSSDRRRIEEQLADRVGVSIAKMFYESERARISDQRRAG